MKNIIFIHSMFQNPKSWNNWNGFFTEKGYHCQAPAWPNHEGDPADLRANPTIGLGDLRLQTVVDKIQQEIDKVESPILIGHSVGGLIVQLMINKGYGIAGVCINSVAPNAMMTFDWGFFKNSATIANPFKGNDPFIMDLETFHNGFCNTMSMEETKAAYDAYATHDSRNVFRDCMTDVGKVDMDIPHVPLLFIAGDKDEIVPAELNEKNAKAYTDQSSIVSFHQFPNRGHFICGQPGWEDVANYVYNWLQEHEIGVPIHSAVL